MNSITLTQEQHNAISIVFSEPTVTALVHDSLFSQRNDLYDALGGQAATLTKCLEDRTHSITVPERYFIVIAKWARTNSIEVQFLLTGGKIKGSVAK